MPSEKKEGQAKANLPLDPGAPTRRARKTISGCKCILLTIVIVVLLAVGLFSALFVWQIFSDFNNPHRALYHESPLGETPGRAAVVQPLISREQTFDIAATVWVRQLKRVGHAEAAGLLKTEPVYEGSIETFMEGAELGGNIDQVIEQYLEVPIFSGIVFRGLRLTDKNVFNTVNFLLPTAIFRAKNLSNYDLRGSFVLLPTSPSLLDHVTNYSSWIPDQVMPFAHRSWPFPLDSPDHGEKSLTDKALESFGATVPLLAFSSVRSRCTEPIEDDADEEDDEEENQYETSIASDSLLTNKGKPLLKSHPYVITRTQIQVIDQTKLFNRKAYMKSHKMLKATSCGQLALGAKPNRYLCQRQYKTNGNAETLLQLGIVNQATGKVKTEWAYAPYIFAPDASAGPKDLLEIPVNREDCESSGAKWIDASNPSKILPEQEFIKVTWRLSYSGRTPAKHMLSILFKNSISHHFNQTEHELGLAQETAEITHGLIGHKFVEEAHPRRRALLQAFGGALSIIIFLLEIRYWYSCRSTIGISILGTALVVGTQIFIEVAGTILQGRRNRLGPLEWLGPILFTAFTTLVIPLLMLKAILRVELGWWKGTRWVLALQIAEATHKERASERLETRMSRSVIALVFFCLVALYYAISPHTYQVISANLPANEIISDWLADISPFVVYPISIVGRGLQFVLNWQSRSYAGHSGSATVLAAVVNAILLMTFVPVIVGRYDARPALLLQDVIEYALSFADAWQALTLPRVSLKSEDEHME